jgi:predicted DNA-binding transcriptional regulator YafY
MAVQSQKKKLLAVMQILLHRSDENHTLTAQDICSILENTYGITAERKGIYADVEALQEMGVDIIQNKGSAAGYYVGSREFELAELKLLVDAVQSSKFISGKRTEELIKKLENLTSSYQAQQLQRQVFICNRTKTENKNVLLSVDGIHSAMQ